MIIDYITISELNSSQIKQYRKSILLAFPEIISKSSIIINYWRRIEKYFPNYQLFGINEKGKIVAFINSIPFYWGESLEELPKEGWDWMVLKGIKDYENGAIPNSLGGLQIIVPKEYQGQGYSKVIIEKIKKIAIEQGLLNFVIPIRPTFKSRHPYMSMETYIQYREEGKIYDPWIRTHIKGGAKLLHVCDRAMHIYGNIDFWESIMKKTISQSGTYLVEGALNPVVINVENDFGEYYEDNIWISYNITDELT